PRLETAGLQGGGGSCGEDRGRRRDRPRPDRNRVCAGGGGVSGLGRGRGRACEREGDLASAYAAVSERHADEPDVFHLCGMFAGKAEELASRLRPLAERERKGRNSVESFKPDESLLGDLSRLFVLAQECWIDATILRQGAL